MKYYLKVRAVGFTLIELVIVIVVLGILAAFAIPRFVDLSTEADKSVNAKTISAFESAIHLAHMKWLVLDKPSSVVISGTSVAMSSGGWPQDANCSVLWTNILGSETPVSGSFSNGSAGYYAIKSGSFCFYIYQRKISPIRYFRYQDTTGAIVKVNP